MDYLFETELFGLVLRAFSLIALVGAVGALAFGVHDVTRRPRRGAGDRNWRFLFSCWADSTLIMVLYAGVNLIWLFERLSGMSSMAVDVSPLRAPFVTMTVEAVLFIAILIVAVRLLLRIRRFLEHV